MTQKINEMKTGKRFSVRAIATVLCFVMLLTAIGSASVLNAFAAYINSDAPDGAAVAAAGAAVRGIADDALNAQADEDEPALDKKGDADLAETGYSGCRIKGSWDSWVLHTISSSSYSVTLSANTTYSFVYLAGDNDDQFATSTTITGSVSSYNIPRDYNGVAISLKTTVAGSYVFSFNGYDGGQTSMSVNITYPAGSTTTTWTAVGAYGAASTADAGFFGTAWAPTATANDLTNSGTTWSKTWSNVTLTAQKTVYYKVAKNHAWDTAYPSSNATKTIPAGTYNITITYNESTNAVNLTYTSTLNTLTVASVENAVVTATYNGTTANEGSSISNVPAGASVTISVTPDANYQCTEVTSSAGGTITGSGNSYTLRMPSAATTVSATIAGVTLKKIYFNNSYTLYGSVHAYVYENGNEYLGKYPGTTMTKLPNSNIWYIEVPNNVDYVKFVSGEGYTTGELTIPWTSYTYPKYTAPYGHNDAPTVANGGTWGNYLYGDDNKRTNEYTVSKGTTMNASNLFTGITATMYDYYTDGEITNSAGTASDTGASSAPKGWIKGINNTEYTWGNDDGSLKNGWEWNPYRTLNSALSTYSSTSSVSYPLYFGNLNVTSKDSNNNSKYAINTVGGAGGEMDRRTEIVNYTGWNQNANGSIALSHDYNAVTGLSGKSLAGSTIHYYKSGATDENGAPMAMFDEDFLSGENSQNKPLASILRTAAFPVRKEEKLGVVYCDVSSISGWVHNSGWKVFAHFYNSDDDWTRVEGTCTGYVYKFIVPSGYKGVKFYRAASIATTGSSSANWKDAGNLPTDGKNKYTTNLGDTGSWSTDSSSTYRHTYYEYDSTNGKDNAYIESISKTNKTAVINYYNNTNKVHSSSLTNGFFPFNRNSYVPDQSHLDYAQDLGFGMKLTIPFTLNENGLNEDGTAQTFDFSGDDDLWVFVDGKLVLDLGGAHARTTGSINFNTKTVTATNTQAIGSAARNSSFASGFNTNPNYVHTMTIYYMERGMFDSNLKFGFSFHAIPNQFWIDKKIRTKDIINSGFYASNGKTGSASNQDDTMTAAEGRFISKFEASYQNEAFEVTHMYGDSAAGATTPAYNKSYTIDNDTTTYKTPAEGTYPIKHDLGNAFIGQFTTGQYFNLKETFDGSNKYVYTPVFSVWDQANNDQAITATGDNSSGYTFQFNPTTDNSGGIENTNIKARFENYMVAHTLTLTKELTNATDPDASFTVRVTFDFDNNGYIAYPLYCDLDGVRTHLDDNGEISIKPGQILEIEEIPQNAKIKVEEVYTDTIDGYRYSNLTLTKNNGATTVQPFSNDTKGKQFYMGDGDITGVIKNEKPSYQYEITYTYPSYDNLYGDQSYTVSGVFTDDEVKSYLTLNGSTPAFKTTELKKTFVNLKAPLEDNFMQTLDFSNATISNESWTGSQFNCVARPVVTDTPTVNAYFNLPYAVNSSLEPVVSSGKVAKIAPVAQGEKDVTCFDWYVTSGVSKWTDGWTQENTTFVNAPLVIYDGSTPYYFNYWSVKKQESYGMKSTEYTRCYDYQFNLSLFMDCIIEPVYKITWAQTSGNPTPPESYNDYEHYYPTAQVIAERASGEEGFGITFLENSRNQYNRNQDGTVTSRDKGAAADVIYSDFLLNFNYQEDLGLLKEKFANTKKAGLVVEAVGYLDGTNATTFNTLKDYKSQYTDEQEETKMAEIKTWLEAGAPKASRPSGCGNSQFDVSALDNKNCIQWYYALNNRALDSNTGQLLNTTQNRYKILRAYAYIGDVSGSGLSDVKLSKPIYFTIYDMASSGLANNATGK
ncbi:fibro-slime domain-containing protein [Ruminococcus sp.]|uniref:fibro-slime domain-containing protein n=1 Tax=Ruminococcus sp. TaxID=41978 RepID=UPI003890BA75